MVDNHRTGGRTQSKPQAANSHSLESDGSNAHTERKGAENKEGQKKCQKTNESDTHHKPPTNKNQGLIMHINATEKTGRIIFLDQIKAIMIALVIATHTILVGTLFTTDLKQIIEAAPAYEAISFWFGWICNTFYMNILFLISGYLLPSSVQKRGVANFTTHRLLRLGAPLIVAIFILNNITPIAGIFIPNSTVFGLSLIHI